MLDRSKGRCQMKTVGPTGTEAVIALNILCKTLTTEPGTFHLFTVLYMRSKW
jgi:hypothetical protein